MPSTEKQQRFVELFTAYMARHESYGSLSRLMASLTFEELRDCLSTYLDVSRRYAAADTFSLRIFYELALLAIPSGDVYFALRFEALASSKGSAWFTRHTALTAGQRARLAREVLRKRRALSPSQRRFMDLFAEAMKRHDEKAISKYIFALRHARRYECLLVYVEISARYPDDDHTSLVIFFGLLSLVLANGDAFLVAKLETWLHATGTIWSTRFHALEGWQREELRKQIVDKKKGMQVTSDARPADVHERRRNARRTAVQQKFIKAFDEFMAKHDQKPISEFLFALGFQQLRECLIVYLEVSDGSPFSLHIFYGISALVIARGDAYYAFKFEHLVHTVGTVWSERYTALKPWQRNELEKEINRKRLAARVLDEFRFAYFRKNQKDPSLRELRAFEPPVNEELRKMLSDVLGRCHRAARTHDVEEFLKAFDDLANLFEAQKDNTTFLVMLKWCRESRDVASLIRAELYWYGVAALFLHGMATRPLVYLNGFSEEEKQFLLDTGGAASPYIGDFERRLDYAVFKRSGRPELQAISKAHAALVVIADRYDIHLVPMEEAERVRSLAEGLRTASSKSIDALRIPINSPLSPNKTLRIGDTIGNIYIVWWDRTKGLAYIEVNGLGRILFSIDSYTKLGRAHHNDALYRQIWRNTQHLMVLIPGFFQILGYLPDLVSGGFTGLVKSIAVDYLAGEISQRAFGDSAVGNVAATVATGTLTGHLTRGRNADDLVENEARQVARAGDRAADRTAGQRARPGVTHAAGEGGTPGGASARAAVETGQLGRWSPQRLLGPGKISGTATLTATATGIDPVLAQSLGGILDVPFTRMPGFKTAWNHIATTNAQRIRGVQDLFEGQLTKSEIAAAARTTFDTLRPQFWSYVGTSNDFAAKSIRDQLSHAGFRVPRDGTAPYLRVRAQQTSLTHPDGSPARGSSVVAPPDSGVYEFRLDIDHIKELGQHPSLAFSSRNLRLTPSKENRIALNQLHMQDPHLPDARLTTGRATTRAGRFRFDPRDEGAAPHVGLLMAPGDEALSRTAAADAQAAIEEASRRLDESAPDDPF